jgi:hypothetical protein
MGVTVAVAVGDIVIEGVGVLDGVPVPVGELSILGVGDTDNVMVGV